MKQIIKNSFWVLLLFCGNACTNLDEHAYDVIIANEFYNNKDEILSAVLRPYTHANAWTTPSGQDGWWRLAELSGDQLAWPTKGRHGEDNGKWKRLHYHTWTVDESGIANAWKLMYWGVGLCNDPIRKLDSLDLAKVGITEEEKTSYMAELKLLRAFHYLKLLDLFGNVPIQTTVPDNLNAELPETSSKEEVYKFIEDEIKDNIADVPVLSQEMKGRMTKAGGYAMLTELYLNSEAWIGTPRWDDCIAAADQIIKGIGGAQNGKMTLDSNVTDTYSNTNDISSTEVIFSVAYDYKTANFPIGLEEFFHFKEKEIEGFGRNGNDGVVLIPGVYTTYKDNDMRKKSWFLIGQQYKFADGTEVTGSEEYDGKPLVFVDYIRKASKGGTASTMSEGEENSGVRFHKYKLGNSIAGIVNGKTVQPDVNYNNNDWDTYRLSWIYFAKAEALMRKNGGIATQEAVDLVNAVRKRAFPAKSWKANKYTTATLTMDELLAERGREFIFEGFRRDDLIRFGKLTTGTWWDHQPSQDFRKLFPIPQQQISLNPKLTQNPGYN
ncbi:Starch-binding associating with outer membrane [bacterium A37T11]|nr:Starch-binding associating with outer membrane [bacterium A37T11]